MRLRSHNRSSLTLSSNRILVRKKRVTANKDSGIRKSDLITLPCEIRIRILKHLLRSRSPLGKRSELDLHPAILRTCTTFAEDHRRTPLLYTNKFMLTLLIDRYDSEIRFLDYNISSSIGHQLQKSSSLPAILLQRVQNVAVAIYIDYGEGAEPQTEVDTFDHRSSVSDLIKPLSAFRALQNLEIYVNNVHGLAEDNPFGNDILDSLQELRDLKYVTICGTSSAHATKLKTIMESSETSDSLQDMKHALQEYLGQEFYDDEDWDDIQDALGRYDVELFIRTREKIVERTEAARTALRLQLYRFDKVDVTKRRN